MKYKLFDVIKVLGLKQHNDTQYYKCTRYCNDNNDIRVEIRVDVKPFETYSISIYNVRIFPTERLNEGVEVRDADIFIKMIEILENKYKIKIINKKLNYDYSWLSRNR